MIGKLMGKDVKGGEKKIGKIILIKKKRIIERRKRKGIDFEKEGEIVKMEVKVDKKKKEKKGSGNVKKSVFENEDKGEIEMKLLKEKLKWMKKMMKEGEKVIV